ncbi:hypothetical protein [Trujillonella humicola]|uniref:hypothetical protein n=1 Tax=Trujillonella humicola TaxID=3383699 RepID=UPI0039063970
MTTTGILLLVVLPGLAALAATTLAVAVRGGRGPADPPASHARTDLGGFPVLPAPRGVLPVRRPRARPRPDHPGPRNGAVRRRRPAFRFRSAPGMPMHR